MYDHEPGAIPPYGPCLSLFAGDAALLPMATTEWAIEFITLCRIRDDDAELILRNRLAGTARV